MKSSKLGWNFQNPKTDVWLTQPCPLIIGLGTQALEREGKVVDIQVTHETQGPHTDIKAGYRQDLVKSPLGGFV